MFEYFYNESIRKVVIIFGTLFNNIQIQQRNDEGKVYFKGNVYIKSGGKHVHAQYERVEIL